MKRVRCTLTYKADLWMADIEYEEIKEKADAGEIEKEIKGNIDDILLEDRKNESSKITSFYFERQW